MKSALALCQPAKYSSRSFCVVFNFSRNFFMVSAAASSATPEASKFSSFLISSSIKRLYQKIQRFQNFRNQPISAIANIGTKCKRYKRLSVPHKNLTQLSTYAILSLGNERTNERKQTRLALERKPQVNLNKKPNTNSS